MTDQETISILREAAKILTNHKWCRRYYALTHTKEVVFPLNPSAESFCAIGVLCKAAGHDPTPVGPESTKCSTKAAYALEDTLGVRRGDLSVWNDKRARDKRQVIRAINKTIKRLEAEQ